MLSFDFISRSEEQTRRLGSQLGKLLQPGDVICLAGELGTGKTCFVQGIGQGLGIEEPITSPSFTFVKEYRLGGALTLYHVDLYRIENVKETLTIGIEEYLYGDGACVVEWADRAIEALPAEHLWIAFRHINERERGILMKAKGKRYEKLLLDFKEGRG